MALTKADIIDAIQSKNDLTKKQCAQVTESIIDLMKSTLASGSENRMRKNRKAAMDHLCGIKGCRHRHQYKRW